MSLNLRVTAMLNTALSNRRHDLNDEGYFRLKSFIHPAFRSDHLSPILLIHPKYYYHLRVGYFVVKVLYCVIHNQNTGNFRFLSLPYIDIFSRYLFARR